MNPTTTYTPTTCGRFIPSDVEPDACERCSSGCDAHDLDRVLTRLASYTAALIGVRASLPPAVSAHDVLGDVIENLTEVIEEFRD